MSSYPCAMAPARRIFSPSYRNVTSFLVTTYRIFGRNVSTAISVRIPWGAQNTRRTGRVPLVRACPCLYPGGVVKVTSRCRCGRLLRATAGWMARCAVCGNGRCPAVYQGRRCRRRWGIAAAASRRGGDERMGGRRWSPRTWSPGPPGRSSAAGRADRGHRLRRPPDPPVRPHHARRPGHRGGPRGLRQRRGARRGAADRLREPARVALPPRRGRRTG
jgi:hypothetical protein